MREPSPPCGPGTRPVGCAMEPNERNFVESSRRNLHNAMSAAQKCHKILHLSSAWDGGSGGRSTVLGRGSGAQPSTAHSAASSRRERSAKRIPLYSDKTGPQPCHVTPRRIDIPLQMNKSRLSLLLAPRPRTRRPSQKTSKTNEQEQTRDGTCDVERKGERAG